MNFASASAISWSICSPDLPFVDSNVINYLVLASGALVSIEPSSYCSLVISTPNLIMSASTVVPSFTGNFGFPTNLI